MLHPLPLPLSSCLGCIPPLIGLPSLRFYAVGSSLFLLSVCFCLCSLFYRDDVLCWLLLARPFLYAFHAHLRFPVDLVWFRLSCDHGWIRSGSVNVRKQQQQQLLYRRYFQHAHFIPIVGVGKRGEYYLVRGDLPRQHSFGTNYLEVYWPRAGGLSAVNAIGTQLRDPIKSGLTRWRMAVINE